MNDIQLKIDRLTKSYNAKEIQLFLDNMYPYIMTKANSYLHEGAEKYRKSDAFNFPKSEWTNQDIELITLGCEQVMNGMGLTVDKPFKQLGVRGFNILFSMFHFRSIKRKTKRLGSGCFLDEMSFEHVINHGEVTYFNLVERDLLM